MKMDNKNVLLKLIGIKKEFEDTTVVKNLNLDIYEGEFLTLLGSSGCGKTTTLRMIAGFETPTLGKIEIKGEDVSSKEPFDRNINTVFQSYALFPHMNIYNNIAFGLKMKKVKKSEIKKSVEDALELVQLPGIGNRLPHQLSGGQRQRVAIARALVNNPEVLLLDEPLGALDLKLRKQMQIELKRIQRKLGITFIYVTHDQEEALTMSDRIVIMNDGCLEQIGTPDEIYEHPKTKYVATFIGETNIFEAKVLAVEGDKLSLDVDGVVMDGIGSDFTIGDLVNISVRPEKIRYSETKLDTGCFSAITKEHIYVGSMIKGIFMLPNEQEIKIQRLSGRNLPETNETTYIYWYPEDAVVMHAQTTGGDIDEASEE
jgi:spermidine/putrescine transport system ATP-binding protein